MERAPDAPRSPVRHRQHDLVSNWSHTNNEHAPPAPPVAGAYPRAPSPSGRRHFKDSDHFAHGPSVEEAPVAGLSPRAPSPSGRRHFRDPDHFAHGPAAAPTVEQAAGFGGSPRGRRHFAEADALRNLVEPDGGPRRMVDLVSNWSH